MAARPATTGNSAVPSPASKSISAPPTSRAATASPRPSRSAAARSPPASRWANASNISAPRARGWAGCRPTMSCSTAPPASPGSGSTPPRPARRSLRRGPTTLIVSLRTPVDKFGWVAGIGAEVMLGSPNWIGRVEYLHYDLGQTATSSTTIQAGGFRDVSPAGSQHIDVVRAGVSYKFGETTKFASVPYAKAPAISAPFANWAGFYAGAHGGYGWGENPFSYRTCLRWSTTARSAAPGRRAGWPADTSVTTGSMTASSPASKPT